MAHEKFKISALIFILTGILMTSGETNVFTKDYTVRLPEKIISYKHSVAIKSKNELLFLTQNHDDGRISFFDSYRQICSLMMDSTILRRIIFPKTLDNGKVLLSDYLMKVIYVVDPESCVVSATIPINTEGITDFYGKNSIHDVITYEDTFDIYDDKQRYCTPCRYNDKGESIKMLHFFNPDKLKPDSNLISEAHGVTLSLIKDEENPHVNYVYFSSPIHGKALFLNSDATSVIKTLSSEFKEIREKLIQHPIRTYSTEFGHISICYADCYPAVFGCHENVCQLLDSNLETKMKVRMENFNGYFEGKLGYMLYPFIKNLPDGGAMVTLQLLTNVPNYGHRRAIYVQRIHEDGRVDSPILVNDFPGKESSWLGDFILSGNRYCSVYENEDSKDIKVKCLDLEEPADY